MSCLCSGRLCSDYASFVERRRGDYRILMSALFALLISHHHQQRYLSAAFQFEDTYCRTHSPRPSNPNAPEGTSTESINMDEFDPLNSPSRTHTEPVRAIHLSRTRSY